MRVAILLLSLLTACSATEGKTGGAADSRAAAPRGPQPTSARLPSPQLLDLDGRTCAPLDLPAGRIAVLVFVVTDCPIANAYAPWIERLWQQLRGSEVDCLLVHCDPDLTLAAARAHQGEYALSIPAVLDREQRLARAVGATMTPEVAVVTPAGVQYLGRIDDRWRARGQDGQQAQQHDLLAALAAVRAGKLVAVPRTPVVGCHLPPPP